MLKTYPSRAVSAAPSDTRRQLVVFFSLLLVYALLAFLLVATGLQETQGAQLGMPASQMPASALVMGLANAGLILVGYGLLGLAGYWFARRLGLPGIFRPGAGWRAWLVTPLWVGALVGLVMILGDRLFSALGQVQGFPHPAFPASLIAAATAGIGEEIMFRLFVMSLWAFLLHLILRRWKGRSLALWIGNLIGALAFGAGHLPAVMFLYNVTNPADLPGLVLGEVFLLNGVLGLVAGERYLRDGLVAAAGVHFWADILWHVLFPLLTL